MHFGTPHALFLAQSVRFHPARDVVYLNNAKAGCSTIKGALIRSIRRDRGDPPGGPLTPSEVHGENEAWSPAHEAIGADTRCFTVVRNPFVRVVSAYLDKIARKNMLRFQFLVNQRVGPDYDMSFGEFLRRLEANPHFALADQHYRPQVENVYLGSLAPMRVFYLENFGSTSGMLREWLGWDLEFDIRDIHGTNAAAKLARFYDDETAAIVRRLYAADFQRFGYSPRLEEAGEAPGAWRDMPEVDAAARRSVDLAALARHGQAAGEAVRARAGSAPLALHDRLVLAEAGLADADPDGLEAEAGSAAKTAIGAGRLVALLFLVRRAERRGDRAAAVGLLRQVIALCPYLVLQRHRMALHLIELGRLDEARAQRFALHHGSQRKELVSQLNQILGPPRQA